MKHVNFSHPTDPSVENADKTDQPVSVAAIDIGSNSLRLEIGQVFPDGSLEVLERLQRAVRLGQSTFRQGRLKAGCVRTAVDILRDFRRTMDLYQVKYYRAVATSAVREARNADTFIDRVLMSTALKVEVIDPSEESRLTVTAVKNSLQNALPKNHAPSLIADVGGGSTLLTTIRQGKITGSQSVNLGAIRLQESLATANESPERAKTILSRQIKNVVSAVQSTLPIKRIKNVLAIGGDARFVAQQIAGRNFQDFYNLKRREFDRVVNRCVNQSAEQLARIYALPFETAETINPALLVYQSLLHALKIENIIVLENSMRDGLLLDVSRKILCEEDHSLTEGVVRSAMTVANKYKVNVKHAQCVANLADQLFEHTSALHGLGKRHRLLLRVASLMHDIGGYVNSRAHHKHSYYLILNSEIFGLTREESRIAAHVARYHRKSKPKPSHTEYTALPQESRMVINKLAAILRVADALDRSHEQRIRIVKTECIDGDFVIFLDGAGDMTIEQRSMHTKGNLFEDIYGMRVRLEEYRND